MPHVTLAEAVSRQMPRVRAELAELVALRSVAGSGDEPPAEDCAKAASWVAEAIAAEGAQDVRLLDAGDGTETVIGRFPGQPGAPEVVLYSHYDVVSEQDADDWATPPFQLTEREGRWYGRGAADCKGNIVMHLAAVRALRAAHPGEGPMPVSVTVLVEGSEEPGRGALERLLSEQPDLLSPDVVLVADTGNFDTGVPTLTTTLRGMVVAEVTVSTLSGERHSGQFGGAVPDALTALIRVLATLHDENGDTVINGLDPGPSWDGHVHYPEDRLREEAGLLGGVELMGTGTVADRLWSRPSATVLALDTPSVSRAVPSLLPSCTALVSLRIPPGTDPDYAYEALAKHLHGAVPWGGRLEMRPVTTGAAFAGRTDGRAHQAMASAMAEAYGRQTLTAGAGGSISVSRTFQSLYPDAEVLLFGVEDRLANIHAPNESVDPAEIAAMAHGEALFLRGLAQTR